MKNSTYTILDIPRYNEESYPPNSFGLSGMLRFRQALLMGITSAVLHPLVISRQVISGTFSCDYSGRYKKNANRNVPYSHIDGCPHHFTAGSVF